MTETKNIITSFSDKSSQVKVKSKSSQVQQIRRAEQKSKPFSELLADIEEQIEIECFEKCDRRQAEEIALIIAEVMKLPDDCAVRIAGNDLPAEMVASIFTRIENDHVIEVMRHYQEATYEIKNTKTYLRTALYNSVFEIESRIDNEIRSMGY